MQQYLRRWSHGFWQAVSRKTPRRTPAVFLRSGVLPGGCWFLAVAVLLASCTPDANPHTSPSLQAWIDTVPLLSIGSVEGDGPLVFTSIQSVALSPEGSLAVGLAPGWIGPRPRFLEHPFTLCPRHAPPSVQRIASLHGHLFPL